MTCESRSSSFLTPRFMRASGNYDQAALMVELMDGDPAHQPVCLISYSRALKQ